MSAPPVHGSKQAVRPVCIYLPPRVHHDPYFPLPRHGLRARCIMRQHRQGHPERARHPQPQPCTGMQAKRLSRRHSVMGPHIAGTYRHTRPDVRRPARHIHTAVSHTGIRPARQHDRGGNEFGRLRTIRRIQRTLRRPEHGNGRPGRAALSRSGQCLSPADRHA